MGWLQAGPSPGQAPQGFPGPAFCATLSTSVDVCMYIYIYIYDYIYIYIYMYMCVYTAYKHKYRYIDMWRGVYINIYKPLHQWIWCIRICCLTTQTSLNLQNVFIYVCPVPQKLRWNGLHVFTNNNGYVACQNMGLKTTKMVICQTLTWMMDLYSGVHLEVVGEK